MLKVALFADLAKLDLQVELSDKELKIIEEYKTNNADNKVFIDRITKRITNVNNNRKELEGKVKEAQDKVSKASTEKEIVNVEKDKVYLYTNKDKKEIKVKVTAVDGVKNAEGKEDPNLAQVSSLNAEGNVEGNEYAVMKAELKNIQKEAPKEIDLTTFKADFQGSTFDITTAKYKINISLEGLDNEKVYGKVNSVTPDESKP